MFSRLEIFTEKKLVGKRIHVSFSDNKTEALWRSFMPRKNEIKNSIGSELYSVEVYAPLFFNNFNPDNTFDKWATIEVSDYNAIPKDMETLMIPTGLYAVFIHKGPASIGPKTYQYIFETWLPNSEYTVDDRPHFAIMGEKYKHEDPSSEEEIWTSIKPKTNNKDGN